MAFKLIVDNNEVVKYSKQLKKMHKSDFPLAVRGTLNDLAFDVKKDTLIKSYNKRFTVRAPSFIKRFSAVEKAKGFSISSMNSKVGIKPGSNIAAKNLTQQEKGGKVKKRDFIYKDEARIGKSRSKRVRKGNWLDHNEHVKGRPSNKGRTRKSNFVAAAIVSQKTGKFVLWKKGFEVFYATKVTFSGKGKNRRVKIASKQVATYSKGRTATLKATRFLSKASIETQNKANIFYSKNAKKRFNKRFVA